MVFMNVSQSGVRGYEHGAKYASVSGWAVELILYEVLVCKKMALKIVIAVGDSEPMCIQSFVISYS